MSNTTEATTGGSKFGLNRRVRRILLYVTMYGSALLFIVPYLWMVSGAFKTSQEMFSPEPDWIPSPVTFEWLGLILSNSQIVQWTINTVIIAVATTLIVVVVDSMIAYSLVHLDWPGRRVVLGLILASFMVPVYVNMVPLYVLVSDLGLLDSLWGVILPLTAFPLGVFMFFQFFRDMPEELFEAAKLDGFSSFQIYLRIVLPLMRSAIGALGLYIFVWSWNRFLWPLLVMTTESNYTVPVGIVAMQPTNTYQPQIRMMGSIFAALPLFLLLIVLQDKLVNAVQMQAGKA